MEIVRTDTLFGSKKNIVGSTTADLVLETLGKVYIKTGKSTKTLTEILSEYSKEGNNRKSSEINTEEVSKLLSAEYMENLIILILNKKKIFGEFVTVDTVRSKGNYNLPIYFDSKAEAQTILGLSIQNKIETQDIVLGLKGVSAGGVCDLTISGGYGGGGISQDVLDSFWEEKEFWIQNQIDSTLEDELISYKSIQLAVSFSGSSIKTITALAQNTEGVISATFTNIPDAGLNQSGLVNYEPQTFYGVKTFNDGILLINNISLKSKTTGNADRDLLKINLNNEIIVSDSSSVSKIYGQNINFYIKPLSTEVLIATLNQDGLHVEQGIACKGICDLTLDPVSARILALEDRIYALEHPNE